MSFLINDKSDNFSISFAQAQEILFNLLRYWQPQTDAPLKLQPLAFTALHYTTPNRCYATKAL